MSVQCRVCLLYVLLKISTLTLAMDQLLVTALLLLIVSAVSDSRNMQVRVE